MQPLYEIKLDIDQEYKDLINDLVKFSTIFFVSVFLYCNVHPVANKTLERNIVEIYALLCLGVLAYHLVVKLFVGFK